MAAIVSIRGLVKRYASGFEALKGVDLDIEEGEVLALLGPNGAGKTTLISAVCGIVTPSAGTVTVGGHDVIAEYRAARRLIGLVPQEISLELFETVINTVAHTRALFGKRRDMDHVREVLRILGLDEKAEAQTMELSGGMKRRVLIAKALSHQPRVLFLDEPTAGVDVELRRGMWETVRRLKAEGVTIILTTHYIEEAGAIADRIAVIDKGAIRLVEEKAELMRRLGRKEVRLELAEPVPEVPEPLSGYDLRIEGGDLVYAYETGAARTGVTRLLADVAAAGLTVRDLSTHQSSLEEIFVGLLEDA